MTVKYRKQLVAFDADVDVKKGASMSAPRSGVKC